jgi:hypothetical protein
MHRLREHHRAKRAASGRSNALAWDTTSRPSADTVILGCARSSSPGKCLHLGADRTFDKPYPPRPKAFLHVNDQGWPITGESPRLALESRGAAQPQPSPKVMVPSATPEIRTPDLPNSLYLMDFPTSLEGSGQGPPWAIAFRPGRTRAPASGGIAAAAQSNKAMRSKMEVPRTCACHEAVSHEDVPINEWRVTRLTGLDIPWSPVIQSWSRTAPVNHRARVTLAGLQAGTSTRIQW